MLAISELLVFFSVLRGHRHTDWHTNRRLWNSICFAQVMTLRYAIQLITPRH